MITLAEKQGNEFVTHTSLYYSDKSLKLFISTRFDGYGNVVVRFIVAFEGEEILFEKFDSAVEYYNSKLLIGE